MNVIQNILIALIFSGSPFLAAGQSIVNSTIVWEADQTTDLGTGTSTTISCQFISTGSQSVEWIQKKGTVSTTYAVTSVTGSWADISSNGSVTYQVSRKGRDMKMVFEKDDTGTFVTMIFEQNNAVSRLRFHIKSVR